MKETINEFMLKGYHFLAAALVNAGIMIGNVVQGVIEGSWMLCIVGAMVCIPWILLFLEMYRGRKKRLEMIEFLEEALNGLDGISKLLVRYHKLYGPLPAEEKPVEKEESKNE